MPTKKKATTSAIPDPEAIGIHGMLCEEIASFLEDRRYVGAQQVENLSDRMVCLLRAIKDVRVVAGKAHNGEDFEHLGDWAALHAVSRLDETDINIYRLEQVRKLVEKLLSCEPEEYAQSMAALAMRSDPRIDEILGEARLGTHLVERIVALTTEVGTLTQVYHEEFDYAATQPEGLRAVPQRVKDSRDPNWRQTKPKAAKR